MNADNTLGRSEQNTNEAGWQRGPAQAHTMSSPSYSPRPQTVTARMVDPSASGEWAHPLASVSADYARHGSLYGGYSPSMPAHKPGQQQQPTLAALALADSRGQLDSGLGHYYQPQRLRSDLRGSQGFYSEPASGAGSPACSVSSGSAR
ncbi:hypothetical protein H4S01_006768, partial [Coemansia sp. RSA 2610]